MISKPNPRQLVLRRDTATGLTRVGWDSDLPIGRFEHYKVICEISDSRLPDIDSPHYTNYQAACCTAREANAALLEKQIQHHTSQGWLHVPLGLSSNTETLQADEFGNFTAAAMSLMFELTHNQKQVWAVADKTNIVHVRSRLPTTELDELSYQVWYHQQMHQLDNLSGQILEGDLQITESGLWFKIQA